MIYRGYQIVMTADGWRITQYKNGKLLGTARSDEAAMDMVDDEIRRQREEQKQ
jgi:hypothetical protein